MITLFTESLYPLNVSSKTGALSALPALTQCLAEQALKYLLSKSMCEEVDHKACVGEEGGKNERERGWEKMGVFSMWSKEQVWRQTWLDGEQALVKPL